MVDQRAVTEWSVSLTVGAVVNTILVASLCHTWRHWRQVRFYTVMLTVGNWLEILFRFAVNLAWYLTPSWDLKFESICPLLVVLRQLGTNLATMSLAALSVHTLLTVLTGSQGQKLHHLVVIGLFVLLSFPLALSTVMAPQLAPHTHSQNRSQHCSLDPAFTVEQTGTTLPLVIIQSVALVFFPLLVFMVCGMASVILVATSDRRNVKGDEHSSDIVITGLQGLILLVCSVPLVSYELYITSNGSSKHIASRDEVIHGLGYLEHCRNALSAIVAVAFAYLHVYRNRSRFDCIHRLVIPWGTTAEERQRLVNKISSS